MTTLARRNSSIHKIREYTLPKINLDEEYDIMHVMQEGWRGRLLLVEHKSTRKEVVLKAVHKECTSKLEFFREFHYNYYLSPHINILNAYDVAFQANDYYIFAQEYAPFGDLTSNLSETGLGEANVKKIAPQIVSALEFMHSKDLVHRNINMDNILVFNIDFSEVKLCDFGSTRKSKSLLKRKTVSLPYAPPEVVDTVQNESFYASTKQDVWQLGVLLYILLTGALPWQKADVTDPRYLEYINWKKRKTLKTPKRFSNFTAKALKMFKRLLEPKPDKRATVREVTKYLEDKWLVRPMKRQDSEMDNQSVCYSTISVHSSKAEKDRVLHALKAHGIETTVDRVAKRKRIHEWIEKSLLNNYIFEEMENENNNDTYGNDSSKQYMTIKEPNATETYFYTSPRKPPEIPSLSKKFSDVTTLNSKSYHRLEQNLDRNKFITSPRNDPTVHQAKEPFEKQGFNSANMHVKYTSSLNRHTASAASANVKRTPSLQEKYPHSTVPVEYVHNFSRETSSSKSQYHRSPTRSSLSPLKTHSRSQYLAGVGSSNSNIASTQNDTITRNQGRSNNSNRIPPIAPASNNASNERNKSLARKYIPEADVRRSKVHSQVHFSSAVTTTNPDSEDSISHSDDSLTSVIPVTYYH